MPKKSLISKMFQIKVNPDFIYYNHYGLCGNICDQFGNPIKFRSLTKEKPVRGYGYCLFVIRELEPTTIYIYHFSNVKHPEDFDNMNNEFDCVTRKPKVVHHNCIALDRRVISAGTIEFYSKTRNVKISNQSGHYFPNEKSLEYVTYLLNNLGYNVKEIELF